MFIDFLGLKDRKFLKNNLVVFYGKSGSWKSTYLEYFLRKKEYKNNSVFLFHKEKKIIFEKYKEKNIFIDEIVSIYWMYVVLRYLLDWKKLFIATHIHSFFYKLIFNLFYKWSYFFTDKNNKKIEKILEDKGYTFTQDSIDDFIKKYSWNFSDLEIILSFYKNNKNFNEILYLFEEECDISYNNNK